MLSKLKKQEKGFTIIEVLIVLVIAGLIMLIVFLAVPALQRNSRNTQRKNDVSSILGAVSEWSNNNNGRLPGVGTVAPATVASEEAAALANAKLGIYSGQVTFVAGAVTNTNATTESTAVVVRGAKCAANGDDATSTGATSRAFAVMYKVETGNTSDFICQEG